MNMLRSKEESYRQEILDLEQKISDLKNEEKQRAKKLLDQVHVKINQERDNQLNELHKKLSKKQQEFNQQLESDIQKIQENMSVLAKELSEKILTQLVEQGKERVKKHVHN
jgi:vacuolar-type H+-ATPase subunit H